MILRPSHEMRETPATRGYTFDAVTLDVGVGRRIVVWHVHAEDPKALVLVVPGSDANKSRYAEGLPVFIPHGYDVVLMDYEGFGDSPGTPTLAHLVDDVFAAARFAQTRHEHVVLFGASIGTPLVARVAAELALAGCIFEGTLILRDEVELWLRSNHVHLPHLWHVANMFIHPQTPDDYDVMTYIAGVDEPKLFLHSIEDEVTPYAGVQRILEVAPEPKTLWTMRGRHGRMIRIETDAYIKTVVDWLDAHVVAGDKAK